jgi:predicted component of type VI protein secretion system
MSQTFGKFTGNTDERTLGVNVSDDILRLINASMRGGRWHDDKHSPSMSSVMNYGHSPLAVFGDGVVDIKSLALAIKNILVIFEPRLEPSSLSILAMIEDRKFNSAKPHTQWPVFVIEGILKETGDPFRMRLQIDVTYGHASVDM